MAFNPSRRKYTKYTNPYKRVSKRVLITFEGWFTKKFTEKGFHKEFARVLKEEGITLKEWNEWLKSP